MSSKQIEAVLKLDGPSRYDHFVKQVVDWEQAWGLYDQGWTMGADDDENPTFQLWPAKEYAELCAVGLWEGREPAAIPLEDLLEELLPMLRRDGVGLGIFRTPEGVSVMPSVEQLTEDLRNEMLRYE